MDMAQSILGKNIEAINPDGSIVPVENETSFDCEPGHAAMALGEFHRATGLTEIDGRNIVDLTAACITAQTNDKEYTEDGLAYSSLGLLAFGPSKDRNLVWEKLSEETRKNLDKRLLARSDYEDHLQIFNIAKAVARFSMGLSKKDETGKQGMGRSESIWNELNVIGVTDGIYNDTVAISKESPYYTPELIDALQQCFINIINTDEGQAIFSVYSHTGYAIAKDSDYDGARAALEVVS